MIIASDTIQKIEELAESVLEKIGASDIQKKVRLAVKFARCQPSEEITLDGQRVTAVAVDIASVFSAEGSYQQYADENGTVRTVESCRVLSIVVADDEACLCKCDFDVILATRPQEEEFINAVYWTTDVDHLTENYIC